LGFNYKGDEAEEQLENKAVAKIVRK